MKDETRTREITATKAVHQKQEENSYHNSTLLYNNNKTLPADNENATTVLNALM